MSEKKEIYTYEAPWPVYGLHWCQRPQTLRLALSSFVQEYNNKLQIVELSPDQGKLNLVAQADHAYPATKINWIPLKHAQQDKLATSGDYLRLWHLDGGNLNPLATLANVRRSGGRRDVCAPLTSFDWNDTDPNMIVTSSIDTTCTVWDINTQQAKTQLIAHDKEVFDVAFAKGTDIFASVGADGSVRMFDLRSLEHSTIMYETSPSPTQAENPSLLRLSWNKQDPNYMATFQSESNNVIILDIRVPAVPVTELKGHSSPVTSCQWAPHSSGHILTAGEDSQALVWEIVQATKGKPIMDPILCYNADSEINNLSWNAAQPEWVSLCFGKSVQALKI